MSHGLHVMEYLLRKTSTFSDKCKLPTSKSWLLKALKGSEKGTTAKTDYRGALREACVSHFVQSGAPSVGDLAGQTRKDLGLILQPGCSVIVYASWDIERRWPHQVKRQYGICSGNNFMVPESISIGKRSTVSGGPFCVEEDHCF